MVARYRVRRSPCRNVSRDLCHTSAPPCPGATAGKTGAVLRFLLSGYRRVEPVLCTVSDMTPSPYLSVLSEHPNREDILEVLLLAGMLSPEQILMLAATWQPGNALAREARGLALGLESSHVLSSLHAQDAFRAAFEAFLAGDDEHVTPPAALNAMRAVFDAFAAVFARPDLTDEQYAALLAPWWNATA